MALDFTALFYQDPYQKSFEGQVVQALGPMERGALQGEGLVFDQSCFYPEGGGQPGDRGQLLVDGKEAVAVLDCFYQDGQQVHLCTSALPVGQAFTGVLDWERRFELMQQHSGEHIFSGLAHAAHGCENVGFHINEEEMTLDFDRVLDAPAIRALETKANAVIYQNLPIQIHYPKDRELESLAYRSKKELEGAVRLVVIDGVDRCACCGTQLAKTGEIGLLKITAWQHYKGGVRLHMRCGIRALRDYQALHEEAVALGQALSAPSRELLAPLTQLQAKAEDVAEALLQSQGALLLARFEAAGAPSHFFVQIAGLSKEALKLLGKEAGRLAKGWALLLTDGGPEAFSHRFVLHAEGQDLSAVFALLQERFGLQGGGRQGFYQGQMAGELEAIEAFVLAWTRGDACD